MSLFCWCERWDLNPHDLTDTSTSSLPVCRFQHARERNLRYYNKIPPFVKRPPEKLPESFAVRPVAQAYKNSFFQGKEKKPRSLAASRVFLLVREAGLEFNKENFQQQITSNYVIFSSETIKHGISQSSCFIEDGPLKGQNKGRSKNV